MDLGSRKFIGGSGAYKKLAKDDTFSSWSKGFMKEEADRLIALEEAKQRELAKQEELAKKKGGFDPFNEPGDIIGTAAKGLVHFGSKVANDIATGFNNDETESNKRTEDFMKTIGADKWDERESYTGNLVGGILGGIPESIYGSAKNVAKDIRNANVVQDRIGAQEDARQALQNWQDRPDLMRKTLKPGETEEQKIKQLTALRNGDGSAGYNEAADYIQKRNATEAGGDWASTFLNIATFGVSGSVSKSIGKELSEQALKKAAGQDIPKIIDAAINSKTLNGLAKDNFTRKVVADTMLGAAQSGAEGAKNGQGVSAEEIGIGAALAVLAHGKGAIKARREAVAEATNATQRSEFLTRREQENAAKQSAMDSAQQQLNANAASQRQLRLPAVSETNKAGMAQRLAEIDDAETRLASNDPDYLRENNLYDVEGGDRRYKELTTEDPVNMKAQQEASAALREADDQVTYYNKIQAESPYFRQVNRAEASRKEELSRMEEMAQDPELDPRGIQSAIDDINAKYDEKLQNLANKYPEDAMQKPMLDQAVEQATTARIQAEENLNNLVAEQKNAAFKEANSIAETPSAEKIKAHQQALQQERAEIEARQKQAEEFSQTPNRSEADVDKEVTMLDEGVHPDSGTPRESRTRQKLDRQKTAYKETAVTEAAPETKLTSAEKLQQKETTTTQALDEIEQPNKNKPLFRNLFELPSEYMRARGLNKLADFYDRSVIRVNNENYKDVREMQGWQKLAKGNKTVTMFKAADGDAKAFEALTPGGKEVILKWRAKAKEWGRQLGLPEEVLDRPYISHIIVDDNVRSKLNKLSDDLKEINAKLNAGEGDTRSLTAQKAKVLEKMGNELDSKGKDYATISGKINNRFMKERYGADGYEMDFWTAIHAYSRAKNVKLYMEDVTTQMAKVANRADDAGMKAFLDKQISTVKNGKSELDRKMDNALVEQFGLPKNMGTKAAVQARRMLSLSKIGFSINSIINSSMQLATIPGVLNADGAVVGFMRTQKLLAKLGSGTASETEKALWRKMVKNGVFEGDSQLLPESKLQGLGKIIDTGAFAGIKGADRYMRIVTYLGAEHKARQLQAKGKLPKGEGEVDLYAWRMTNKANQNFAHLNAPQAFQSQVSKTLWSMMTFLPGTIVRGGEVGMGGLRGIKNAAVIGHSKLTGKPVTAGEFKDAIGDISRAAWMGVSMWGMSSLIGSITGNGEVVPNPFDKSSYNTPVMQFLFGNDTSGGLTNFWTEGPTDKYSRDENGNIVNESRDERVNQFFTNTLWASTVPGFAQGKRLVDGYNDNQKGYSENSKGKVQWVNDKDNDIKRMVFGKYSTDEGKEYVKNLKTPEGGPLSKQDTETFKSVPKELRNQYYDFFKSSDTLSGRPEADSEVSQLYREGKVQQARRKAAEYNAKVDKAMAKFYSKYKYLDPDIQDELSENLYITLTRRGEKQRANSKDN